MATEHAEKHYAIAQASKSFFIDMLTRDITLEDCILDLLDNSVDGAKKRSGPVSAAGKYAGTTAKIDFTDRFFQIKDNGSGISVIEAEKYAFRFGNEELGRNASLDAIGAYGIGMKRAMFKLGNQVHLSTSTGKESFKLDLDVAQWKKDKSPTWRFPLTDVRMNGTTVERGTSIRINELHTEIVERLTNPRFENMLRRVVQRDYGYILSQGFDVQVNGVKLKGEIPEFRQSDDLAPGVSNEVVKRVAIRIKAGLAEAPPDDTSAEAGSPKADRWGWYVVCNDRVVVAGDKSALTGWGADEVPSWHPQYNGFLGIVEFNGPAAELPWLTTKRNVDPTHPAYVRALVKMKQMATQFTIYTNRRKGSAKAAKAKERAAPKVPVTHFSTNQDLKLPLIEDSRQALIEYRKPEREVKALAQALGLVSASSSEVGMRAFEYAYQREVK